MSCAVAPDIVRALPAGVRAVQQLARRWDFDAATLSALLGVAPELVDGLADWPAEELAHLPDFPERCSLLLGLYADCCRQSAAATAPAHEADVPAWLTRPMPCFDGRTPLAVMQENLDGLRQVRRTLHELVA